MEMSHKKRNHEDGRKDGDPRKRSKMGTTTTAGPSPSPPVVEVKVKHGRFRNLEEYVVRLEGLLRVAWAENAKLASELKDLKERTREITEEDCQELFTGLTGINNGPSNQEPPTNAAIKLSAENPLETPKILKLVFRYLDLAQLKICREINKTWNRTVSSMLSTSPVGIIELTQFNVDRLAGIMASSPDFPFRNFRITSGTFPQMLSFFRKFGPLIRVCHLWLTENPELDTYSPVENSELLQILPNLESLSFARPNLFPSDGDDEVLPAFNFGSLKSLNLGYPQNNRNFITPCLPPHLETLTVNVGNHGLDIDYMGSVKVLKVGAFYVHRQSAAAAFEQLLAQHRQTLTQLVFEATINTYNLAHRMTFPRMELLALLRIPLPMPRELVHPRMFGPARASDLPVLRHVESTLAVINAIFMDGEDRFESVRTVQVSGREEGRMGTWRGYEGQMLQEVLIHFPCLTTFEYRDVKGFNALKGPELQVIFGYRTLESLYFVYADGEANINNVLCGLPPDVSTSRMLETLDISRPNWLSHWETFIHPRRPSLRDLGRLKSCKIESRRSPVDETVTEKVNDVSGYLAFGKLPGLTFLGLRQIGKVSKESLGHRVHVKEPGSASSGSSKDVREIELLIVDHWTYNSRDLWTDWIEPTPSV